MDKLFEFLTSKIGYTIGIILGFLFPGMLFVFVWNCKVYFELGLVRLIILALCISFAIFIPNFFATSFSFMVQEKAGDREVELYSILGSPIVIANLEIYFALVYKLEKSEFTIIQFIDIVIFLAIGLGVVGIIPSSIKLLWRKVRKHKK